ncbi:MAG TPA: hypothetical protein VGE86_04060 [Thermoanaerobaculia bacterium]
MTEKKECAACGHEIDAAARICPYCAGDPETGRRVDPAPLLQSHFPMRDTTPKARVAEFLRERQGLVVTAVIIGVFLLVGAAHQMVTRRNQALESSAPAVPLTDLADLNQPSEEKQLPIPDLEFTWTGRAETMDVLLVEPGAVAPPAPPAGPPGAAVQLPANAAPPASAVQPPPIRQERPLGARPPAKQPPQHPQGAVH